MTEENNYLTIADINRRTGISERSLRRYRDQFQIYIPYSGQGRQRVYPEEAVPIFERIAELKNKGKTGREIGNVLNSEVKAINAETEQAANRQAAGRQGLDLANTSELAKALPGLQAGNQQILKGVLQILHNQEQRMKQLEQGQKMLVDTRKQAQEKEELRKKADRLIQAARKEIDTQRAHLKEKDEKIKHLEKQLQETQKKPKRKWWFKGKDW